MLLALTVQYFETLFLCRNHVTGSPIIDSVERTTKEKRKEREFQKHFFGSHRSFSMIDDYCDTPKNKYLKSSLFNRVDG